jgi:Domain of unknown function (DUF4410)
MMRLGITIGAVAALVLAAGCASSRVAQQQSTAEAEGLTPPDLVVVYDFAGTPDDLPSDSVIARYYEQRTVPQTPAQIELGRRLGRLVAENLVKELKAAGIPAEPVDSAPIPLIGDAVIRGEFLAVNEGSRLTRMLIGFGAGAAVMKTLVEVYQVTPTGLRPLGSGQVEAKGSKLPGMLVPVGIGAGVGSVAVSAAVSGAANVAQEAGPETIEGAARRTAKEIARPIIDGYKKRGWL